jgi:hypothetical protein
MGTGIIESLVAAVSEALKRSAGRKNIVVIITVMLLAVMEDRSLWTLSLMAVVALAGIASQWYLDLRKVRLWEKAATIVAKRKDMKDVTEEE